MKKGIHPDYQLTKITCVCGNVIETRSTVKDIHVEICSACHPFYTGKQKLVDTAGRIDRFNKRYGIKDNKQFCKKTSKQGSLFSFKCHTDLGIANAIPFFLIWKRRQSFRIRVVLFA